MKTILIIGIALISVFAVLFVVKSIFFTSSASQKSHTVVLTADGFQPELTKIKKGERITFKTAAGKPFWPASDIHPTHGIYPEFDPKEAISASKTWSFKFDKVGRWSYHDHLAPYFTGKIVVK